MADSTLSHRFLWIECNLEKHPDFDSDLRTTSGNSSGPKTNTAELMQRLFDHAINEHVLVLQSSMFAAYPAFSLDFAKVADGKAQAALAEDEALLSDRACFLRVCYAGNYEQLDLAAQRLGVAVKRFFDGEVAPPSGI